MKALFPLLAFFLAGCVTGSVIPVGQARQPISPSEVRFYADPPTDYETIAVISSVAQNVIVTGDNKAAAVSRLKNEAAKLGANGVLITGTNDDWWSGSGINAKAIFVRSSK